MISIPPVSYCVTIVSVPWLMWGVVAFTIKVFRVPKLTPRKLLASDGYLNYVENHPLVFGTVTLTTFLSWLFKLTAHTPKNCRSESICQDFQSLRLIQFCLPSRNAPILPLVWKINRPFSKTSFFNSFLTDTPHTVSKSHLHPLQHVLPAITGPNTLGVVFYALGILVWI
jgi:hypothetical protein